MNEFHIETDISQYLERNFTYVNNLKNAVNKLQDEPQILENKTLNTIKQQYNIISKDDEKKNQLQKLIFTTRFLYDYLDLVHDFTVCVNFLNPFVKSAPIMSEFDSFVNDLCSTGFHGNIRVKRSYKLQLELLDKFIEGLRNIGFTVPSRVEYVTVLKDNLQDFIKTPQKYYRESGRGLEDYSSKAQLIKKNAVGLIDGCAGQCAIGAKKERIVWEQLLLGFITAKLETNIRPGISKLTLQSNPPYENIELVVELSDKITLDNVLKFLPSSISDKAVRDEESSKDAIKIVSFSNKNTGEDLSSLFKDPNSLPKDKEKYFIFLILIKTICDKTVIQLIKEQDKNRERLDIVCTTDTYVPTIPTIEYLCGEIDFCTAGFLSNIAGWNVFAYPTLGEDNFLLKNRLFYLVGWLSQYNNDLVGRLTQNRNKYAQIIRDIQIYLKSTDDLFESTQVRVGTFGEITPENLWDYLQIISVANMSERWNTKKEEFYAKIVDITNKMLSNNDFTNSLLSVPTSLDMDHEIMELLNESDGYEPFDDNEYLAAINEELIYQVLGSGDIANSIRNKLKAKQDLDESEVKVFESVANIAADVLENASDFEGIIKKIKAKVLKEKFNLFDFLHINTRSEEERVNMEITEDYCKIKINVTYGNFKQFSFAVQAFNTLNEESVRVITFEGDLNGYPTHINIPVTAQFLINFLKYLKDEGVKNGKVYTKKLIHSNLGSALYNIMEKWIGRNFRNKNDFIRFLDQVFHTSNDMPLKRLSVQSRKRSRSKSRSRSRSKSQSQMRSQSQGRSRKRPKQSGGNSVMRRTIKKH